MASAVARSSLCNGVSLDIGGSGMSCWAEGATVQRRRHQDRGTRREVRCREECLFQLGMESGEGSVPPPQKIFSLLRGKWHTLVHSGCYSLQTAVIYSCTD